MTPLMCLFWGHGGNASQDVNTTAATEETDQGGLRALVGRYEIDLPAGPLYGRIRIRAWSIFDISPTEYLNAQFRRGMHFAPLTCHVLPENSQ